MSSGPGARRCSTWRHGPREPANLPRCRTRSGLSDTDSSAETLSVLLRTQSRLAARAPAITEPDANPRVPPGPSHAHTHTQCQASLPTQWMSLCLQESSSCRKPRLSIVHCCLLHRLAIFCRPLPWARTYCWCFPARTSPVLFILGLGGVRYEGTGLQHPPFLQRSFVPPTRRSPPPSLPASLRDAAPSLVLYGMFVRRRGQGAGTAGPDSARRFKALLWCEWFVFGQSKVCCCYLRTSSCPPLLSKLHPLLN